MCVQLETNSKTLSLPPQPCTRVTELKKGMKVAPLAESLVVERADRLQISH